MGVVAQPRSRREIRDIAKAVRACAGGKDCFDIVRFLENLLPELVPGAIMHIVPDSQLPGEYAHTYPDRNLIEVRQSVYLGAVRFKNPRDRFTLAHEFGHFLLHRAHNISYPRSVESVPLIKIQSGRPTPLQESCLFLKKLLPAAP